MKRLPILIAMLIAFLSSGILMGQGVKVLLKSGEVVTYTAADLDYVQFVSGNVAGTGTNILTPDFIPDAALRAAIDERYANGTGFLSKEDALAFDGVIWLAQETEIKSLEGLELFPNATGLNIDGCKAVDPATIPAMPKATYFNISFCNFNPFDIFKLFPNVEDLNIGGNKFKEFSPASDKLVTLTCDNNYMERLDVSKCNALVELTCSANKLQSLTLGNSPLEALYASYNQSIGDIDFSHVTATLKHLNVAETGITSLDLSGCALLEEVECQGNALSSTPNFNGCTKLQRIRVEETGITSLDVSGLYSLEELQCYSNNIKSLDLSGLSKLMTCNAGNNGMTRLKVNNCRSLVRLTCGRNKLTHIDLSNTTNDVDIFWDFQCELTPTLKEIKVWSAFDTATPPSTWFINEGARYVYEFSETPDEDDEGGDEGDPETKTYTVKFTFTNPGTENCLNFTVNWVAYTEPFTGEIKIEEGQYLYFSCKPQWKITALTKNGETVNWTGAVTILVSEDVEYSVTAVEADKEHCTLNIDNPAAIELYIDDQLVEGLHAGDNTLEFYSRSEAYFMPKSGFQITSLKIGEWGYAFEAEGKNNLSLEDGAKIIITTQAKTE